MFGISASHSQSRDLQTSLELENESSIRSMDVYCT